MQVRLGEKLLFAGEKKFNHEVPFQLYQLSDACSALVLPYSGSLCRCTVMPFSLLQD